MDLTALGQAPSLLSGTIGNFNLPGGSVFSPTYLHAALVLFCIFVFILAFAMFQRRQHQENIKNTMPGIAFGFAIAIVLEAMLLVGGRTVLTEFLGWENAPKPISNALDASRTRLVEVLGVTDEIPESNASSPMSVKQLNEHYESLNSEDQELLQNLVCPRE